MSIVSTIVKFKRESNIDNDWIEKELSNLEGEVVRWAIIEIDDSELTLTVSLDK